MLYCLLSGGRAAIRGRLVSWWSLLVGSLIEHRVLIAYPCFLRGLLSSTLDW